MYAPTPKPLRARWRAYAADVRRRFWISSLPFGLVGALLASGVESRFATLGWAYLGFFGFETAVMLAVRRRG